MSQATRSQAFVDAKAGGEFIYYDGGISGTFIEIEKGKLIKENWKLKNWSSYSEVEMIFRDYGDECEINVKQINIPAGEDKLTVKSGWENQFFRPLSVMCGFPIRSFDN